ncbi:hypothetical protein R1flu_003096 [Riccia fluitans]|uniref:Uncharacterized protein n=1 Tax=Riccia fluitans TaxID=41844 RepID=A0ABD1Y8D3_9MARC
MKGLPFLKEGNYKEGMKDLEVVFWLEEERDKAVLEAAEWESSLEEILTESSPDFGFKSIWPFMWVSGLKWHSAARRRASIAAW